ncbi:transcriptional repressor LexA [Tessaracoccus sp. OH4464_COT-324]|uniref:transcriptional repressor LexA n=1 Tax=Tessaracoccus sp. OH4464_COT-324 TaxID=2491059 RepID=UPI000F62CA9A|nr:transcriptional repressor LexA [Tessaracoccus sp. OH4464_COT-324]RRD47477.1 transcriptional repressor LexA [Tessaracoccus sp. OH4464_COT-324]
MRDSRVGRPSKAQLAAELGEAPNAALSARAYKILGVIRESLEKRGFPPSVREMADASGLSSPSSVSHQLRALEEAGYIRRESNRSRSLVLTDPLTRQQLPFPSPEPENGRTVRAPLVGRIAAGGPILAEQHVEDVFQLPEQLVGHGDFFMLEVKGDSMIDAAICDGDWVVVRRQEVASNGEIVAALLDDEATVKTLRRTGSEVWLQPANENYDPIDGRGCRIMGKVVAVLRRV